MRNKNCTLCNLHEDANTVCLWGRGENKKVVVVGEAPGEQEDDEGRPFVGSSGQLLRKHLDAFKLSDVYITNSVKCRPPENKTPTKRFVTACNVYLKEELSGAKFVLLLGNVALQAVLGIKGIKKVRGQAIVKDGVTYFPAFHPAYILRDPTQEGVFRTDISNFAAIVSGVKELDDSPNLDVRIINTLKDVRQAVIDIRNSKVTSFDLETTGLYAWAKEAQIVSFGLGTGKYQWVLPAHHQESPWSKQEVKDIILRLVEAARRTIIVTHNGKFDLLWLWVCFGIHWRSDFDTMLAAHAVDENRKLSLKLLASDILGAPNYDIDKDEKQGNAPYKDIAKYHSFDLLYTRDLYFVFKEKLAEDPAVERMFYKLTMPTMKLFVEVEYDGVHLNMAEFKNVEKRLRIKVEECLVKLNKIAKINWGSPKQVGDLLFRKLKIPSIEKTKGGADSTSESVLKRIDHPVVDTLLAYRGAMQQLSFFIEGWKPYLDNGKLHPSFKIHGTVTGRLSCENPNLQQVPRDPEIRSLIAGYTDDDGYEWVLVEADLSQIELRIAAEMSGDEEMMYCFQNGIDIHWKTVLRELFRSGGERKLILKTASHIKGEAVTNFGKAIKVLEKAGPDVAVDFNALWKELRKKAKAINFGYLYGMWWKKFIIYARDNYGVKVTEEEAQASREFFFESYTSLEPWHKRQKNFARRNGYVRSMIGRKRRLPNAMLHVEEGDKHTKMKRDEAQRQAINSPVQGLASDLNLMAALELRKRYSRKVLRLGGTVHDALLVWVRRDVLEEAIDDIKDCMENPPMLKEVFDVEFTVPIEAEVKVGAWGKGKNPVSYFKLEAEALAKVPPRVPLQVRLKAREERRRSSVDIRKDPTRDAGKLRKRG